MIPASTTTNPSSAFPNVHRRLPIERDDVDHAAERDEACDRDREDREAVVVVELLLLLSASLSES